MPNCPLCQKTCTFYFQSKDYNRRISTEAFNHYRCPECQLIFIAPVPDNLGDYYPPSYYSQAPTLAQLIKGAQNEQYKIEIIKKLITGGRLLEIGPAYGTFCCLAKQAGFEVEAIEMDAACCQFLSEVVGIKTIHDENVVSALKNQNPYNVIALWHVIEHLPAPWKVLDAISEKTLPGGIVLIATPNPDAWQFQILGKLWPHVDAPRHLLLIPSELLIKKMNSLGFKTVLSTTLDKGSLGWNTFGWQHFFSNMCPFKSIKFGLRIFGNFVSLICATFERIEGKGSTYTTVFMKEK